MGDLNTEDNMARGIQKLSKTINQQLIDSGFSKEMIELLMVSKVSEEAGESVQAMFNLIGGSPRKGKCGSRAELLGELLDTALTALIAVEKFSNYDGSSMDKLCEKLKLVQSRQKNDENIDPLAAL